MPYPEPHLYLTAQWLDSREPNETGQFGLRFKTTATQVTQAMVDACWTPVETFWISPGAKMPQACKLKSLRLALVAENGQYVPGTFSRDFIHPTGSTSTNTTNAMPLQVAQVVTLLTDRPSGLASHGRAYLPALTSALGTDGRWAAADCNSRASAFAAMLTSLNGVIKETSGAAPAFAAVFSKGTPKTPAGVYSFVRKVTVGTRPDVQRRRAKAMKEVYGTEYSVTGPAPQVP